MPHSSTAPYTPYCPPQMPYTVNFFLQQVAQGLLNGCSFHRNARHVVQGGPVTNHLNPGANLRKPFKVADLSSVAFQEYHPDFPHKKYTLGYAGRPGGPDFYVSTQSKYDI
jgi:cyclophilin family peptidyl-prolyl cis-trans isomerase